MMILGQAFLSITSVILLVGCNTVSGLEDDSMDEHFRTELENIVDIRHKFLKASVTNPEIFQAIRQWNVSQMHGTPSKSNTADAHQCDSDLSYVIKDLINPSPGTDRSWGLKMIDSFGKPPSGFLQGRISWPGNYDECLEVLAPQTNASGYRFHGRYAWLTFTFKSKSSQNATVAVNVGACFPNSCSGDDILQVYNSTAQILDYITFWNPISSKLPNLGVTFVEDEIPLSAASVSCICICSFFAALALAGTAVDAVKRWRDRKPLLVPRIPADVPVLEGLEDQIGNQGPGSSIDINNTDETDGSDTTKLVVIAKYNAKSVGRDFLLCFSVITNTESILNTQSSEGQLNCIHGIRFFSMAWVILGHTYYFGLGTFGNLLSLFEVIDTWPIQVILQGTYSVDTFFLLSGCLLTYHFLKNQEKFTGIKNWVMFYVHRYVRLTPVYAMVMFILATWFSNLGKGPYWNTSFTGMCSKSWWWHLLYINNFLDALNMCVGWAWYLANDMQFYIISPLFLIAFKRNRTAGFLIVSVLLVASWIASGVISRVDNVPVIFSNIDGVSESDLAVQQGNSFDEVYTKPYTRIGPYLIGVLLGCLLDMANGRKKFLHKSVVILGWALSQSLSLLLLYGLLKSHLGPITMSAHVALARSAWGITVGWVIYACLTGHAGVVNTFLSWKVWIPLSRLTYCAYLVHPMVMMWYYNTIRTTIYFTNAQIVILYLSFMVLSYGLAFVTSLLFEAPVMKLEKFMKNL